MVKLVVVVSPSGKKHAVGETNATTKLNRNLFSKKGCKIVNDLSFRHRFFSQKTFDSAKLEDVTQSPDLKWTKTLDRLCKLTKECEFVAADDEKNEPIKTDIRIKRWSLIKYKRLFMHNTKKRLLW